MPAIEAALAKITAIPNAKTRKRNTDEAAAIAAIRAAYVAITGNHGGRVVIKGTLAGNLNRLRREIGDIFGTALFAVRDSKRLR